GRRLGLGEIVAVARYNLGVLYVSVGDEEKMQQFAEGVLPPELAVSLKKQSQLSCCVQHVKTSWDAMFVALNCGTTKRGWLRGYHSFADNYRVYVRSRPTSIRSCSSCTARSIRTWTQCT